MKFFKNYFKKKGLKKFIINLGGLLKRRYGKSKYYTQAQVDRTIKDENLNAMYKYHGYTCFVDPTLVDQIIRADEPISIDLDKITEEIGKLLSADDIKFTIEDIQDSINTYSSSFSDTFGSSDGGSDCGDCD
jgi:hypothetical protein